MVEVAEYSVINNIETVQQAFERFRTAGAQCSIDRFGQSTASVGYLRTLPVDYIKIDGSYTRGIAEASDRQFFVQALVGIAHGLGIKVITEYIESETGIRARQAADGRRRAGLLHRKARVSHAADATQA